MVRERGKKKRKERERREEGKKTKKQKETKAEYVAQFADEYSSATPAVSERPNANVPQMSV